MQQSPAKLDTGESLLTRQQTMKTFSIFFRLSYQSITINYTNKAKKAMKLSLIEGDDVTHFELKNND
jgi:hypothetical protein